MPRSKASLVFNNHQCPNPQCSALFKSQNGLSNHYQWYSICFEISKTTSLALQQDNGYDQPYVDSDNDASATSIQDDYSIDANNNNLTVAANHLNPDTALLLEGKKRPPIHRTPDEYFPTKLLKILDDINAPHYAYKSICEWGKEAYNSNYNFDPERTTRKAQIKHLEHKHKLSYCRPYTVPVTFPQDGLQIRMTKFDFISELFSLLNDTRLTGNMDKLDVNSDNPFTQYKPPDGHLGTFNSGAWYQNAWKYHCKRPHHWMCPLIFGCDETLVGSHLGRASVTPLVFTLSIFSEEIRNTSRAWRPLGYVYDMHQHGKAMNNENPNKICKMKPEEKCSRYHTILKIILQDLVHIQQEGGIKGVAVTLGNVQKQNITIKVPVGMILGDMQGGDKHCASIVGYSSNMARLCRACNVSGEESGDPLIQCKRMSMKKIKQYVINDDKAILKSISQNNVYCAWFDVDFGGCERGIFSAAMPIEALHAIEGGICKDVLNILFTNDLKDARCGGLDNIAKAMCSWEKQYYLTSGSVKSMPRLLFKDGITSLKQLASVHVVGIMLAIVVLALTDDGKAFFEASFLAEYGNKSSNCRSMDKRGAIKRLNDMKYVFSMILSYWSWLKKDSYWQCGDTKACKQAENAIRVMLQELIKLWPRNEGNGWFKPKIHEQLHVPHDINRNGSPRNSYGGPLEHNHLDVKDQSKRTQMHRNTLDYQIGTRHAESYIINHCSERMQPESEDEDEQKQSADTSFSGKSIRSSHGILTLTRGGRGTMNYVFEWSNTTPISKNFPSEVLKFIANSFYSEFHNQTYCHDTMNLKLFTDYRRDGIIFRAHPNYKKNGSWNDWAMFRYAKSDRDLATNKSYRERSHADEVYFGDNPETESEYHYAPGKLCAFVEMPDETIKAVVLCCSFEHVRSGVFSTYWKIEYVNNAKTVPYYALLDVDAIVRHVLMIPENNLEHAFHEIWDRDRWANEFV